MKFEMHAPLAPLMPVSPNNVRGVPRGRKISAGTAELCNSILLENVGKFPLKKLLPDSVCRKSIKQSLKENVRPLNLNTLQSIDKIINDCEDAMRGFATEDPRAPRRGRSRSKRLRQLKQRSLNGCGYCSIRRRPTLSTEAVTGRNELSQRCDHNAHLSLVRLPRRKASLAPSLPPRPLR